ncbi:MAG TPA: TIGR03118 family protein [Candidatus Methanoperedens sp.]
MRNSRMSWETTFAVLLIFGMILNMSQVAAAMGPGSNQYLQTNLVSDISGLAQITDPNLVNSWGIAHPPTGPWWVADNGMGVATVYNGKGQPFPVGNPLIVNIPPPKGGAGLSTPTGIVFNGGQDFEVAPGMPAAFIFVTEDGTISAWNRTVDLHNATLKIDNSPGAVYKGVTIGKKGNANFLYAANFRGGSVDVFDTDFNPVKLSKDAFVDKRIPAGFAPFNVQNIKGEIFVTFAKQDAQKHDNLDGPGLGFVDIFNPDGRLLMRLKHGDWMNAPWGIALAPDDFGKFSDRLLVGNFGSGQIAAFDLKRGNFHGLLKNSSRKPITIDGLWGLGFGNGANAGPVNTLFFAAGIDDEQHGLFGTITPISSDDRYQDSN